MNYMVNGVDISNLLKARDVFERFRKHLDTDQEKAGTVQAFKFCYELALKTMKRVLDKRGIEIRSPRDCFRKAALNNLIRSPEQWFVFIEKRKLSLHTYREENMENMVQIFPVFSRALSELIQNLELTR
jgi:nucleotidyltransferase substrate binding protein (TIGR01987 family)